MSSAPPILEVRDLRKYFPIHKGLFSRTVGHVKAIDGISFDVHAGEVLGLVGESGCGKTTAGRCILQLIQPTSGSVKFEGQEIVGLPRSQMRPLRRRMQIVFQDPYSSLNPRLTVGSILREALTTHGLARGRAADERVAELLDACRPLPDSCGALSARVLRRPAAADRHRPCAGGRSAADRRRRAGLCAGRVDPGAGREPAARSAAATAASPTSSSRTICRS